MNKTMIITGAADRIGAATAHYFAARGWQLALHANTQMEKLNALADTLQAEFNATIKCYQADFLDAGAPHALMQTIRHDFSSIDVLINNAALFDIAQDNIENLDYDVWQRHMMVNAWAPLALIQSFVAHTPNHAGCIINVLDQRVKNITGHFTTYTASKIALSTLTTSLSLALAPHVRVNAVAPGMILPAAGQDADHFTRRRAATPLGQSGQEGPDCQSIVAAIQYFVESRVTGQIMASDGGEHLLQKPPVLPA